MNIRKRITTILAAVALTASLFVSPVTASVNPAPAADIVSPAADEGGSCSTDPERVRLFENNIGDTSDGDDTFLMCGTGIADLDARAHTSPGLCKSGNFRIGDTWNDCVSSIIPIVPSGRMLCLYGAKNYGAPSVKITYSMSNVRRDLAAGFGLNDGLSSLKFSNAAAYC